MKEARVSSRDEMQGVVKTWQAEGYTVVFTNGVFDLLHVGHVRYLQEARKLGDKLIVGVNADKSVKRLKGPLRPINGEADRAEIIAALACVDGAVVFDEDTPVALLAYLKPNIHTKGGDYVSADALPETPFVRAYGGKVVILQLVDGKSTSLMLQRVQDPTI